MWKVISVLFIYFVISVTAKSWNYDEPLNIQGGKLKSIMKRPYLVSISGMHRTKQTRDQVCGGSIIGAKYVLTARHCLTSLTYPFSSLRVRSGSSRWEDGGTEHQIKNVWVPNNGKSDIAILSVEPPFDFSDGTRKPIALPLDGFRPEPKEVGKVSGWGNQGDLDSESAFPSAEIKSVKLPVMRQETCITTMLGLKPPLEDEFCASYMKANSWEGFWNGDSGGPFVINNQLVGIVNRRAGRKRLANLSGQIFTNVGSHRAWIKEKIGI